VAIVVFLRGINVGGHRKFRPGMLARDLADYGVVNIGAAGTFVVRKPGSRAQFRAALSRTLPFEAEIAMCDARDILRLADEDPFASEPARPDLTRFVSILSKAGKAPASLPAGIPPQGEWFVRIIAAKPPFVFGVYRRHMKTIGYLGKIDTLFGAPATTRTWKTIQSVVGVLRA
jgi:uncharacterized protein (DUF1697 family)